MRVGVVKLVDPVLSSAVVPRMILPSRNVTIPPIGCCDCGVFTTLAMKVMVCPLVAGFVLDVSVVVVVACAGWITSISAVLVEEAEFALAPYAAVIVCVPVDRVEMDSVAVPAEVNVPVPRTFALSRKRTTPEGIP